MSDVGKKFILGKDKSPDWFKKQCLNGKAKINYDEDTTKIVSALIYTPTKNILAKTGDVIIMMRSGMGVIPNEKAKKYNVIEE